MISCKHCGCGSFMAIHKSTESVIVNGDGTILKTVENSFDGLEPEGPFKCCKCEVEYCTMAEFQFGYEKPPISFSDEKQYLENGGMKCPVCGSPDISPECDPNPNGSKAYAECSCDYCEATWTERWVLDGIEEAE